MRDLKYFVGVVRIEGKLSQARSCMESPFADAAVFNLCCVDNRRDYRDEDAYDACEDRALLVLTLTYMHISRSQEDIEWQEHRNSSDMVHPKPGFCLHLLYLTSFDYQRTALKFPLSTIQRSQLREHLSLVLLFDKALWLCLLPTPSELEVKISPSRPLAELMLEAPFSEAPYLCLEVVSDNSVKAVLDCACVRIAQHARAKVAGFHLASSCGCELLPERSCA